MRLLFFVLVGVMTVFLSTFYLTSLDNFQTLDFQVFAQSEEKKKNFENATTTHSSETSSNMKEKEKNPQGQNFEKATQSHSSDTSTTIENNYKKPTIKRISVEKSKIHPKVSQIFEHANPKAMAKAFGIPIEGDQLFVYVHLADKKIQNKPLDIEILRQDKNIIVSKLSWSQIQSLVKLDSVEKITLPDIAVPFDHGVSEGVSFSMADKMHTAGFDGSGIKVAVIDTDFITSNPHITDNIVSEWFSPICSDMACNVTDGDSHGTAVAEIVVDMAPAVDLYLYAIFDFGDFRDAIDNATANDVDIITASLGFPEMTGQNEFFRDGTSVAAQKVNQAKNNQTLVTIAAGNDGQKEWSGVYTPNATRLEANLEDDLFTNPGLIPDTIYESVMMFNSSATNSSMQACLPISYHNGTSIFINWSAFPETDQDYDFLIYDSTATNFLGTSAEGFRIENGNDEPDITIATVNLTTDPQDACLVIASFDTTEDHIFHIDFCFLGMCNDSLFNLPDLDTGRRGLSTPADADGAFSVGAINFRHPNGTSTPTDYSDDEFELFSARGPTDLGVLKPEICGPDKTSSTQDLPNTNLFSGTSAATPHVAGAAALLLDQNPFLNATQLEQKLIDLARNDTDFSQDNLCGSNSGSLSLESLFTCSAPVSGNWTISSDCIMSTSDVAPENVIVENNALLTVPSGVTLDINFPSSDLILREGGMVLIKNGGEIT